MSPITTNTSPEERANICAARAANLAKIMEGYEVHDEPDSSVPGAAATKIVNGLLRYHPRYALVTQYGDKGNYRVHLANGRRPVEDLAAYLATDADGGEQSVCYFDLDELAGEEELPTEVVYEGAEWDVVSWECESGEKTGRWTLRKNPTDRRRTSYDWTSAEPDACDLMGWEDERMPVRYGVAKVLVSVVFNTVPSP